MSTFLALTTGLFLGIFVTLAAIAAMYYEKIEALVKKSNEILNVNSELLEHFEIIMTDKESK